MRGNKFVLFLFFLIFFSTIGLAFKVEISPDSQKILLNETAIFNLTIKHSSPSEEIFELYSPDVLWNILSEDMLRIPGHDIFKTRIFIRPLNINPGVYGVPLIFKQVSTNELVEQRPVIETISQYAPSSDYLPAVRGVPEFDSDIDSRVPYEFVISLENKNKRNLPVVEVKVRSNLINKDYTTSLSPLEKKTIKFTINFNPLTKPQEDIFYITILVPEEGKTYQFDLFPVPVRVISYGCVEANISMDKSFLKTVTFVKVINLGNGDHYYTYSSDVSGLNRLFFSSNNDLSSYQGNYEWDILLEPEESAELILVVNYRPVFWAMVILFVLIFCYFVFRSPMVIKKSARVIRTREGGISDVKVVLEIVHRGYRKIQNFEMIDLVPNIAEIIQKDHTTIAPVSVTKSENKGTVIKWVVGLIDPKEHRIITYDIKSKLSILGGLRLPVAVAKFKTEYRFREITSNSVSIKFSSD